MSRSLRVLLLLLLPLVGALVLHPPIWRAKRRTSGTILRDAPIASSSDIPAETSASVVDEHNLKRAAFSSAVGYAEPSIEAEDFDASAWRSALHSALGNVDAALLHRDDLDFALVSITQELLEVEEDIDEDEENKETGFAAFVAEVQQMLGDQVRHLAVVVGAGVIGGGEEVEGVGAVSILLGAFPPETSFEPFVVEPGRVVPEGFTCYEALDELDDVRDGPWGDPSVSGEGRIVSSSSSSSSSSSATATAAEEQEDDPVLALLFDTYEKPSSIFDGFQECPPAFFLFCDPYSRVGDIIDALDEAFPECVVCGGVSCPPLEPPRVDERGFPVVNRRQGLGPAPVPSLAINNRILPSGGCLGFRLVGPFVELHSVCAQGALGVGPTFTVTDPPPDSPFSPASDGYDREGIVSEPTNIVGGLSGQAPLERLKQVVRAEPSARIRQLLTSQLLVGIPKGTDRYLDSLMIMDEVEEADLPQPFYGEDDEQRIDEEETEALGEVDEASMDVVSDEMNSARSNWLARGTKRQRAQRQQQGSNEDQVGSTDEQLSLEQQRQEQRQRQQQNQPITPRRLPWRPPSPLTAKDFLIRQVLGFSGGRDGSIAVGDLVEPGRTLLRFHVRDAKAASVDLRNVLDRYLVERLFSGRLKASSPPSPSLEEREDNAALDGPDAAVSGASTASPPEGASDSCVAFITGDENEEDEAVGSDPDWNLEEACGDDIAAEQLRSSSSGVTRPLATLLFSCNGRGRSMFSEPNHDSAQFQRSLLGEGVEIGSSGLMGGVRRLAAATEGGAVAASMAEVPENEEAEGIGGDGGEGTVGPRRLGTPPVPLSGFFCSGEIAPVGARGVSASDGEGSGSCKTYLHGFTSVFAIIYDKSPAAAQTEQKS